MALNEEFVTEINEAVDEVVESTEPEQTSDKLAEPADSVESTDDKVEAEVSAVIADEAKEVENEEIKEEEKEEGEVKKEEEEPVQIKAPESRDPELFARAVRAGMTVSEVQSFPSDAALAAVCGVMERTQSTETKQKEDKGPDPLDAFANLDPDVYEAETIEMFGALANEIKSQREQLRALTESQQQFATVGNAAAAHEIEKWFDAEVEGLGSDFSESLGTGAYSSLDRGSPQFAKREAIADHMAVTLAGLQATGRPVPSREELFKAAARLVLGDEFAKVSERKLQAALKKRSTQHISRVRKTGDQPTNKSPAEETAALLDEKFFSK